MPPSRRPRPASSMFSLSPVLFRDSAIAGRGVFARKRFAPGDVVTPYAPRQRKVDASSAEAHAAAETKLTLLSGDLVIIPDTSVPGGWLCNHSCEPNATLFSSGDGRIECARAIAPGQEVTIFYGWVSQNAPGRDPCLCGSPRCLGTINFDLSDADVAAIEVVDGQAVLGSMGEGLRARLGAYADHLRSIEQEQVLEVIAATLARMVGRRAAQHRA